jgi:hypothetical protein
MFKIEYIIPVVMSYHLLFLELLKYKKEEVSKNIIHIINSIIFILSHTYNNEMIYITNVTIGFYIYDLIYLTRLILKSSNNLKHHASYIIHHIVGIKILYCSLYNPYIALTWKGYNILEISNIMLYISYHIHKEHKSNNNLLYIADFIELIWYSYYRIIDLSFFLYGIRNQIYEQTFAIYVSVVIIYLMGVSWSYKLLAVNIKNYRSYVSTSSKIDN